MVGMEKELNRNQKSITDSWDLPSIENFDKETLLAGLIVKGGQFGCLYQDPDYFYMMCSYFWKRWESVFTDWFKTIALEYNPIENYNRVEKSKTTPGVTDTITNSGKDTEEHSGTDTTTPSGTTTVTEEFAPNIKQVNETEVSAYDSSSYSPKEKTTTTPTAISGGNTKDTTTNTTSYTDAKTEFEHGEQIDTTHGHVITNTKSGFDQFESQISGNIGVTTSQQMLISQMELQRDWGNVYDHISDIFIKEMLITIW